MIAVHILIAIVYAMEENVDGFVIKRMSIQRYRQVLRSKEQASAVYQTLKDWVLE